MKTYRLLLLLSAMATMCSLATWAASPQASFRGPSAETLLRQCELVKNVDLEKMRVPQSDVSDVMMCLGFLTAVLDADAFNADKRLTRYTSPRRVCAPDSVSGAQLAKVVVKYGDDHPDQLHFPGVAFAIIALKNAFPCK